MLARTAELALVSDALGDAETAAALVDAVAAGLGPWLAGDGDGADVLVYDRTYGGIVSARGLADSEADFGNGWYNDHHFHYGYLLYAAAVACKLDASGAFLEAHKDALYALAYDIASPGGATTGCVFVCALVLCCYSLLLLGFLLLPLLPRAHSRTPPPSYFPKARHKDFFDGHSWASGLFEQANGKSQESSSEAVNAYYAVALFALAAGDDELLAFGRVLLATEILSTKFYWHMPEGTRVYDKAFAANKMVGVVGALDATVSTWFGDRPECVARVATACELRSSTHSSLSLSLSPPLYPQVRARHQHHARHAHH